MGRWPPSQVAALCQARRTRCVGRPPGRRRAPRGRKGRPPPGWSSGPREGPRVRHEVAGCPGHGSSCRTVLARLAPARQAHVHGLCSTGSGRRPSIGPRRATARAGTSGRTRRAPGHRGDQCDDDHCDDDHCDGHPGVASQSPELCSSPAARPGCTFENRRAQLRAAIRSLVSPWRSHSS